MLKASQLKRQTIWQENGNVCLIDQTLLPNEIHILTITTVDAMVDAIKRLAVRGAPAIGIAAAYGMYVAAKSAAHFPSCEFETRLKSAYRQLAESRPTAVNLFWALEQTKAIISRVRELPPKEIVNRLLNLADHLWEEDNKCCKAIGKYGASLLNDGDTILTHCNAGGLATASYGTALAPVYWAVEEEQKYISVIADETRPLLQGARLTAWELQNAGVPVTVICDNMAASVLSAGTVDKIIVGADCIAANGDTANKIGTYSLAIIAAYHNIPFYVAAPLSTFDFSTLSGKDIPIEQRHENELRFASDKMVIPPEASVFNPAFDVTPGKLISGFITEKGIFKTPEEIA